MNTPVILLDVDGALSADAMSSPEQHGYVKHRFEQGTAVLNDTVGRRVGALRVRGELTWCTGWNDRANELLCPLLGWDPLPVLDLTAARQIFDEAWYRGER